MVQTLETRSDENGESLCSVAQELGVDASQLHCWKSQRAQFEELLTHRHGTSVNTGAASIHCGCKSCLHEIEEDHLQFIWEQCEQGLAVSVRMVIMKASQLYAEFRHKTARAKDHAVQHFIASHGIVHQIHTQPSQEYHVTVQNKAEDWIEQMHHRLFGVNQDQRFIINMDQTPIFFSMLPRTTLEASGA